MDTDLGNWQTRLARHFTELQRRRSSEAPDRPIFALEHGLDDTELRRVTSSIQTDIQRRSPCWDHRLVWVVYACEFGYVYAGDEYWQTFEAQTSGWDHYGDRHWIRRCFQDFHERYSGAKPTGAWARHFSIICWPITHAILPRDLQRQVARLLYDLRHAFSPEVLGSPRQLGELIAARSWNASSRFQQLTEEPLFLGQIATALLLQGNGSTSALIHPFTLSRISADVDRERRARAWLRGARESAQHQVQFQHIRGQGIRHGGGERGAAVEAGPATTPGLEPRLVLRPLEPRKWEVLLEFPDFSHIPVKFRRFTEVLANTRCHVTGSSGRPLARGRLLYGPQRVILRTWPRHDEPLLRFENSPPEFDYLLHTECLLRPGPVWLFKVASDGLAYELKSANIRSEQRYILLLGESAELPTCPEFIPVKIDCDGIRAAELQLADTITPDLTAALNVLEIRQAATIHVWPAGLAPVRWDGEGVAEWLSTERPRLGIRADHHVTAFSVDLGFDRIDVSPSAPGAPVFIELPELDPGVYTALINAVHSNDAITECGSLQLRIREPRTWSPGRSSDGAIFVVVEPTTPTLEELWESKIELQVHGPASRRVYCEVAFFKRGASQPFLSKQLPPLSLPIDTSKWRKHLDQHFKKHQDVQNAYDLAQSCRVRAVAGELGTFTLVVEREFSPLRWAVRRTRDGFYLRALDDSGAEQIPQVARYEFIGPDFDQPLDITSYDRAEGAIVSPGLYVVRTGDYLRAVVIAPEVHHTFQDLRVEPRISGRRRATADTIDLIRIVDLWVCARVTGNILSLSMRRDVLLALVQEIFHLIGGDRWARGENTLRKYGGRPVLQCVGPFLKKEEIELAERVRAQIHELARATPMERAQQLALLSTRYLHLHVHGATGDGQSGDTDSRLLWLSELALRLASVSTGTITWAGDKLHQGISYLLEFPGLARAARFMVLALDQTADKSGIGSDLHEGWAWE